MPTAPPSWPARSTAATTDPKSHTSATALNADLAPAPTHAMASLSRDALACIIQLIAANGSCGWTGGAIPYAAGDTGSTTSPSSAAPYVSAEALFAEAIQPTSTAATGAAASPPPSAQTQSGAMTRPLALLAASPHCRRALEEHLVGGCVLAPRGALVLQVRWRDPGWTTPSLHQLQASHASCDVGEDGGRKGRRASKRRSSSSSALCTAGTAVHAAQHLVVTSVNVPVAARSSHQTASCYPSRSPEQRPRSAHAHAPPPLLPSPRQSLRASALSSPSTSPTTVARAATAAPPTAEASASGLAARTPPRVSLSPVLQSRRAPVSALLGSAAGSPSPPPPPPPPPLSRPFSVGGGRGLPSPRAFTPARVSGSTTPPARPLSHATSSPRLLLPLPATPQAAAAGGGGALAAASPPPMTSTPAALEALAHALWWVRRGPLPVSLSLSRYSEGEVRALWDALREDEGDASRGQTPPSAQAAAAASPSTLEARAQLPPVTELHVHGRAADTAITALLQGHPEVRAVRLTHTTLSSTQLRDLTRHCPDVTHLSLAMNDHLRSTSFLCPTPSEASSVATTATTATTKAFTTLALDAPPPPIGGSGSGSGSRSPRSCLRHVTPLLTVSSWPPRVEERQLQPDCHSHSASPLTTARSEGVAVEGQEGADTQDGNTRQTMPTLSFPSPQRSASPHAETDGNEPGLHNSQVDLFAAEEEGEAEMRLSLWQAAQTDAAERRQAVFILRPSDVVLGGADAARRRPVPDRRATPPPTGESRTTHAPPLLTPPSPSVDEPQGARDGDASTSSASATGTATTAPQPPSVSTATHHTGPQRSSAAAAAPPSVDAALAELRSALRRSPTTPAAPRDLVHQEATGTAVGAPRASAVATASAYTGEPYSWSRLDTAAHRSPSAVPRRRTSTHWSETLVDLDLAYTQVLDEDAARDVPRLRVLRRLSLEGCTQLTQLQWLPSLAYLRELNLSFLSVAGAVLSPLGSCRQLVWLKLEGCTGFLSIDQLWTSGEDAGEQPTPTIVAPPPPPTPTSTNTTAVPAAAGPAASVVQHRTAGGITAITVLHHSAAATATTRAAATEESAERHTQVEREGAASLQTPLSTPAAGPQVPRASTPPTHDDPALPLLTTLRALIVTGTALTDAGLLPVRHLSSLECLVIDRCGAVTDVNITAQLPSLHTLDASRTGVTATGLVALREARTLRLLRLQGCLALTRLPTLFVEGNFTTTTTTSASRRVGLAGGDDSQRTGLAAIDVSFCTNLTAGGVTELAVDAATARVHDAATATAWDLHGGRRAVATPPPPQAAATFAVDAADHLRGGSSSSADGVVAPSYTFPQLRHLLLRSCDAVSQLSALQGFTRVVELDLYHTDVDAAALTAATARWTCLEVLNIASTRVSTLAAWCPVAHDVQHGSTGGTALPLPAGGGSAEGQLADVDAMSPPPPRSWMLRPQLPAFAATLRVLTLANTDITSDGLAALRFFPQLVVLQLANCRRLTSLSFLPLQSSAASLEGRGGRRWVRTALRELAVSEAASLTNESSFPFLAACPGLRSLSLAGCTQLGGGPSLWLPAALPSRGPAADRSGGGGGNAFLQAVRPNALSVQLPPLASARRDICSDGGRVADLAVLRAMRGLADLNLSRTAVNHDDLRALLAPPPWAALARAGESRSAVRASTRLDLLVASGAAAAATPTPPFPPVNTGRGGEEESDAAAAAFAVRDLPPPSLERIWLRGCRCVNEETLLASAAVAVEPCSQGKALSALASVQEVYLSQGRFGPGVLSGLLV